MPRDSINDPIPALVREWIQHDTIPHPPGHPRRAPRFSLSAPALRKKFLRRNSGLLDDIRPLATHRRRPFTVYTRQCFWLGIGGAQSPADDGGGAGGPSR